MLFAFAVSAALAASPAHPPRTPDDEAQTPLERAVLAELNELRADPPAYAKKLEALRGEYRGNLIVRGGGLAPIRTVEGVAALDEAIAALQQAPSGAPLAPSLGLMLAAHDQVADEGPTGAVGHAGTDGSNSFQRISRYGRSTGRSGEVIDYGWGDATNIVIDLLVDDGIKSRAHRTCILQPVYEQAGVSCGPHKVFDTMCVVELAQTYASGLSAPSTALAQQITRVTP